MGTRPTIFLDRDGVINRDIPNYVKRWEEFELLPGVFDALGWLYGEGYQLIIVTNQSCINRGLCDAEDVEEIHNRLASTLLEKGVVLTATFCCPHRPDEKCKCRKPEEGMFEAAIRLHDVDMTRSWVLGDSDTDVEAARRLGCRYVRVEKNGNLLESLKNARDLFSPNVGFDKSR